MRVRSFWYAASAIVNIVASSWATLYLLVPILAMMFWFRLAGLSISGIAVKKKWSLKWPKGTFKSAHVVLRRWVANLLSIWPLHMIGAQTILLKPCALAVGISFIWSQRVKVAILY